MPHLSKSPGSAAQAPSSRKSPLVLDLTPINAETARGAALEIARVDAAIWQAAAHARVASPSKTVKVCRRPFIRRAAPRAPRRHIAARAGAESGDSDGGGDRDPAEAASFAEVTA